MILTHLQESPNNVSHLGKIIAPTGFECLPKKQKIAQSGHTDWHCLSTMTFQPWNTMPESLAHVMLLYDLSWPLVGEDATF